MLKQYVSYLGHLSGMTHFLMPHVLINYTCVGKGSLSSNLCPLAEGDCAQLSVSIQWNPDITNLISEQKVFIITLHTQYNFMPLKSFNNIHYH